MRVISRPRWQRGDTIVEVMIVLAILGLAIGICYATANRSLLNARQAQENAQGTSIAQSQLEALISMGCASGNPNCPNLADPTSPNYLLFQTGSHCINQTTTPYTVRTNPDPTKYNTVGYNNACITGSVPYYVSITYTDTPTTPHTFTITVKWPDILGQGMDEVTNNYRLDALPGVAGGGGGGGGGGGSPSCPAGSSGFSDKTVTGTTSGTVWGTGPYTDDSALGAAAVHAGLITVGQTATIRVCKMPGQSSYASSTRNGVTTVTWGSWPGSITLLLVGS